MSLAAQPLEQNAGLCFMGVTLVGEGFRIYPEQLEQLKLTPASAPAVIRPYLIGRDLAQKAEKRYVIDFFGYSEDEAKHKYPRLYQWLLDRAYHERQVNKRKSYREKWWIFGEPRERMRKALHGLPRYIVTGETAKHRFFQFLPATVLPDHKLYAIASDDALLLSVLSSRPHIVWALAAGGTLEDRPTWTNTTCFLPFPFPVCSMFQRNRIRQLGESLDSHRKRQQAAHPDLTITGMYNVLEKLRRGEALNTAERVIHEHGLVSVLKKIHDDLDAAVFDAYGWPHDLTDEQILEKLVKLNAERSEEERKGLIRWLRPEFQNPSGQKAATQTEMVGSEESEEDTAAATAAKAWPKKLPEQIAAVRDLLLGQASAWTAKQVAKQFKGTKLKELELVLESLTALGLLVAFQPNGEMQWKPATAAA
jgi:hypothetical protein